MGILEEKSYKFSIRIVHCCRHLQHDEKEFVLSKQLIRSGTSIGASIAEGRFAQSRADFVSKLSIALKEANETKYWLRLLKDTQLLRNDLAESLLKDIEQLISMLVSSLKTAKNNLSSRKGNL